ncbi:MAG: DNA recombination protein RmuC, partial [Pseudomonadota bacterium]
MDSTLLTIIALILGLAAGAGLGWFFGSRPAADLRERLNVRDDEFKTAIKELGEAQIELSAAQERAARADSLASDLDKAREENSGLRAQAAGFAEQKRLLEESRDKLLKEFENTGAQVLGKAQEAFLKRAEERFKQSEETGEAKIKALLSPVGERLEKYEKQVETLENQRKDAFGQLHGLIQSMREGQEEVRREAQRLGNSLTNAPKARGRWGEQQLKNLLEQVGLAEHTDFELEASIDTEEGRLRPDAIVRIPGGKVLVIDAKVSLNAYQQAFEADNDEARDEALGDHVRSMR